MTDAGSTQFFAGLSELVRSSQVVIDRPEGSRHPRIPAVSYPLDYGYLAGTTSGDGAGLDVFTGTARGSGIAGVLLTVDLVKRDAEMKVLIDCTPDEVETARKFCSETLGIGGHLIIEKTS